MDITKIGEAATIASVLTATNPVEIIKLRLQTAHELLSTGRIKENYSSIRHVIASMAEKEGLRSFWKGNTIGILRFFPNEYINYRARGFLQSVLPNSIGINMGIAVLAGWTSSSILYPFDILRQSLGTNTEKDNKLFGTVRSLIKNHGPRYFYSGFLNSMVGTAVFRGSFNGIYDSAKHRANTLNQKALIAYFCAAIAGGICYPIDIVRRRRILINST
jgi:solute carrier family 25 (mitochondrial adenine nucleotide translocator), member 4/5/6/31